LSRGRLDVGFARAFLPHEFRRFGRSPDESVARFREGIEQVDLLLSREDVTHRGRFHAIENTTSLPRPTQRPRPKFYVAALTNAYLRSLVEAASDWHDGRTSQDYPGYDKVIAALRASNAAEQIAAGGAWIGSPDEIAATIERLQREFGEFEHASLQVNFNTMPYEEALASMRLFAQEVMPRFADSHA